MWVRSLSLVWVLGNALLIFFFLAILFLLLRARLTPFKKKLQVRWAKERESKRRRALVEESVRTHVVPALIKLGFEPAPPRSRDEPYDRKHSGCFPTWGQFARARGSIVDKVEIQFSTYGRAAFRINATAVPKSGMITAGGHRAAEEIHASGLHDHLETHARPWLRPILKGLRVEPLGEWFSLWRWPPDGERLWSARAFRGGSLTRTGSSAPGWEVGPAHPSSQVRAVSTRCARAHSKDES